MACVDPVPPKDVPHGVAPPNVSPPQVPPPASRPTVPGSVPDAGAAPPAESQPGIDTGTAPSPENRGNLPAPILRPALPGSSPPAGDAPDSEPGDSLLDLCIFLPVWVTVPDQESDQVNLPDNFESQDYVTSPPQLLMHSWSLNGAPTGMIIENDGKVIATRDIPAGVHTFTVGVRNSHGEAFSNVIEWDITADPNPPAWTTVPSDDIPEETLPVNLDMKTWASGFGLFGWALVGNPAGVSIDDNGVVNIANTVSGTLNMSCNVSNANGTENSGNFSWEIVEIHVPAPPDWHTPVPNQSDPALDQPVALDMKAYMSSLAPVDWGTNIGEIDSNGILRLDGFPGGLIENISVSAENPDGQTFSNFFDWDLATTVIFEDAFNRSNRDLSNGDNGWQKGGGLDDPMVIRSNAMTLASGIGGSYNEVVVPPATDYRLYIDSLVNLVGQSASLVIYVSTDPVNASDSIGALCTENQILIRETVGGVINNLVTSAGSTARSIMWEYTTNNLRVELGGVEVFNGAVAPSVGGGVLVAGLSFQTPYPQFDDLLIEEI